MRSSLDDEEQERLQIESCFSHKIADDDEEDSKDGQKDFQSSRNCDYLVIKTPKFSSKFDLRNYGSIPSEQLDENNAMQPNFESPTKKVVDINDVNDDAEKDEIQFTKAKEFDQKENPKKPEERKAPKNEENKK